MNDNSVNGGFDSYSFGIQFGILILSQCALDRRLWWQLT